MQKTKKKIKMQPVRVICYNITFKDFPKDNIMLPIVLNPKVSKEDFSNALLLVLMALSAQFDTIEIVNEYVLYAKVL